MKPATKSLCNRAWPCLGEAASSAFINTNLSPQIVESILRSRHDFEGQDFLFKLVREYPRREQVMQYGESDLAFISRLLADVGIWYRFTHDERLNIDVVEFHDDQRHYNVRCRAGLPSAIRAQQRRKRTARGACNRATTWWKNASTSAPTITAWPTLT